ncbi:MAG: calcium:proton antiporter [Epsilonproteobacteria bacterium]|nr:calcium:proton antiporter [Campylobacterota bacterium]
MNISGLLRSEKALWLSLVCLVIIFPLEHFISSGMVGNILGFVVVFAVIIYLAINVAHHAEKLAQKYGEPYGTLILTIAAVIVEIVIIVIMMVSAHSPTLARDTIYSAVMLDINGLLGICAFIGGIKYGEQKYNMDSSNSYISMLLVAFLVAMVLPHFIPAKNLIMYENFTVVAFVLLYILFTKIQLKNHKYFFTYNYKKNEKTEHEHIETKKINGLYHATILSVSIVTIGLLSELLALFMGNSIESIGLPMALGAFVVAVISASPELITAIKSASNNNMQTVINIALGASLATLLLTVPSVIIVAEIMHFNIDLALTPLQMTMIGITLVVSIVHFNDGETNILEGFLNFILFIVFFFLIFVE